MRSTHHRLPPLSRVAAVALGGAVGGSARTWLYLAYAPSPGTLPWVTLAENASGAFAMGLTATLLLTRGSISPAVRAGVTTGLLGAYTTFAGLAMELRLLASDAPLIGLAYLAATLVVGLGAAVAGIGIGRALPLVARKGQP